MLNCDDTSSEAIYDSVSNRVAICTFASRPRMDVHIEQRGKRTHSIQSSGLGAGLQSPDTITLVLCMKHLLGRTGSYSSSMWKEVPPAAECLSNPSLWYLFRGFANRTVHLHVDEKENAALCSDF
jgi:hypothetical protein